MKSTYKNRYYVSHITSKGQTTIPSAVRALLGLNEGSEIAFKPSTHGFILVKIARTVKEESPYSSREWKKIEKLAAAKGKTFHSAKATIKYLRKM